jgi:hypothetical protein
MKDLIAVICESQRWEMPEEIGDEHAFPVDGRLVSLSLFPNDRRIFVFAEAELGQMDMNAYVKLGRFGFSWAIGSGISIGLHPTRDNVTLVGCELKNLNQVRGDADAVHFAMRRIATAAQSLEEHFSVRMAQGRQTISASAARDRIIRQITANQT